MKILFPIGSFYPTTFGGPGTVLYWHGVYLKKNHVQPTFITTTEGIAEPINSDCFLELPCGKVYYGKGGVLRFKTIRILLNEVKGTDIIHLTSLFSPTSIICFLYARLFYKQTKIVWSVRGELNVNALNISKSKKQVVLKIYKQLTKNVVFASTSPKETEEIKAIFPNKIIEIPNVMPNSEKVERTAPNKRFLFLGRIHPIKNIEALIKGFYESQAFTDDHYFLDIAGEVDKRDLDYYNSLKNLVDVLAMHHKVSFLGHVAGFEKEKLLTNAYFLILPSHSENFGNVVIEALNQGTPVIASKNTPWKDLEDFNCGFWVANSPNQIAFALNNAFKLNYDAYTKIRKQAKILVDQKYAIDIRILDWIEAYKALLN